MRTGPLLLAAGAAFTAAPGLALDSNAYFYLTEGIERCFIEELPAQTILIADYQFPEAAAKQVNVRISGPDGSGIDETAEAVGRLAFHSVVAGEHKVCIKSTSAAWPEASKSAKFFLKLEIHGNDAELTPDAAKKSDLSSLEQELETLDNQVDLILKDLEYAKTQEQHFRDQSERINLRIMWWSLFQTLLLLLSGVWQIVHLQNFFRAKKLV